MEIGEPLRRSFMSQQAAGACTPQWLDKPVVLCVDDDPQVLAAIHRTLKSQAYDVVTAPHAAGALDWLEALPISLVIADEHMPIMTGTELLQEVRRRFPETAKVILTGFPGHRVMSRSKAAGADALLFKPWDEEGLRETVRRILAQHLMGPH
jgi:response regulator RpfG family c-di-GMP phosphodiesterase